jgi:hypothetical protein
VSILVQQYCGYIGVSILVQQYCGYIGVSILVLIILAGHFGVSLCQTLYLALAKCDVMKYT